MKFIQLIFLFIALIAAATLPARAVPRDLLATASDEALVLAHVRPPDKNDPDGQTDHTLILTRKLGKETRWRRLATLSGRVVSVAACDEDAKVLLESGDWLTIWTDGQAFGPPAPGVRLIALAADHDVLWAVGLPAPLATQPLATTMQASTSPGTGAASATQPAQWPQTPAVYRFDGANWTRVMSMPIDLPVKDPALFSLEIIDHQPVLALSDGSSGIRIWTGADGRWRESNNLTPPRAILNFGILNVSLPPTLWFTDGGPGVLAGLAGEMPLGPDGAANSDPRSAARAAEAIRLYSASGDHLFEQAYGADGRPMGTRAELDIDLVGPDSQVENWLAPTLTVIVTMFLFGAARRGGIGELPLGLAEANLTLAPLLPRFAAGVIDSLPVLVSILYVARQMSLAGVTDDMPTNEQMVPFYIGSAIYVLYMIGAELVLGRTLGKWIFGLMVVSFRWVTSAACSAGCSQRVAAGRSDPGVASAGDDSVLALTATRRRPRGRHAGGQGERSKQSSKEGRGGLNLDHRLHFAAGPLTEIIREGQAATSPA